MRGILAKGCAEQHMHPAYEHLTAKKYSFLIFCPWQAGCIFCIIYKSSGLKGFIMPFFFLERGTSYLTVLRSNSSFLHSTVPWSAGTPGWCASVKVKMLWYVWAKPPWIVRSYSTASLTSFMLAWHLELSMLTWARQTSCGSKTFLSNATSILEVP